MLANNNNQNVNFTVVLSHKQPESTNVGTRENDSQEVCICSPSQLCFLCFTLQKSSSLKNTTAGTREPFIQNTIQVLGELTKADLVPWTPTKQALEKAVCDHKTPLEIFIPSMCEQGIQ